MLPFPLTGTCNQGATEQSRYKSSTVNFDKVYLFITGSQKPVNRMTTATGSNASGDKPMDDEHRNILRICRKDLVKDMEPMRVLREMKNPHLFTTEDESEIKAENTRVEKCEVFLDKLARKGASAYETFKETIKRVHPHLTSTILEAGK